MRLITKAFACSPLIAALGLYAAACSSTPTEGAPPQTTPTPPPAAAKPITEFRLPDGRLRTLSGSLGHLAKDNAVPAEVVKRFNLGTKQYRFVKSWPVIDHYDTYSYIQVLHGLDVVGTGMGLLVDRETLEVGVANYDLREVSAEKPAATVRAADVRRSLGKLGAKPRSMRLVYSLANPATSDFDAPAPTLAWEVDGLGPEGKGERRYIDARTGKLVLAFPLDEHAAEGPPPPPPPPPVTTTQGACLLDGQTGCEEDPAGCCNDDCDVATNTCMSASTTTTTASCLLDGETGCSENPAGCCADDCNHENDTCETVTSTTSATTSGACLLDGQTGCEEDPAGCCNDDCDVATNTCMSASTTTTTASCLLDGETGCSENPAGCCADDCNHENDTCETVTSTTSATTSSTTSEPPEWCHNAQELADGGTDPCFDNMIGWQGGCPGTFTCQLVTGTENCACQSPFSWDGGPGNPQLDAAALPDGNSTDAAPNGPLVDANIGDGAGFDAGPAFQPDAATFDGSGPTNCTLSNAIYDAHGQGMPNSGNAVGAAGYTVICDDNSTQTNPRNPNYVPFCNTLSSTAGTNTAIQNQAAALAQSLTNTYCTLATVLQANPIAPRANRQISSINIDNTQCNAWFYYSGGAYTEANEQLWFSADTVGTCPTVKLRNFATDTSITSHEFGHEVMQNGIHLVYSGQAGALNEYNSDHIQFLVNGTIVIGNANFHNGTTWTYLRNMAIPEADYFHSRGFVLNAYTGGGDHGGVHTNSGIGNVAAKLLALGGVNPSMNAPQNITVTGIGIVPAFRILFTGLQATGSTTTQFAQWATSSLGVAAFLYGPTSQQVKSMQQTIDAVGLNLNWPNVLSNAPAYIPFER